MSRAQQQTPYRERNTAPEPEPTRSVSDWQAFRVGIGRVMLFPAAIFGGVLFFFWFASIAALLDVVRYVAFRAVEVGHQELGVKNQRCFQSYLYGGVVGWLEGVNEKARMASLVRFFSVASWALSTMCWFAVAGFIFHEQLGGGPGEAAAVAAYLGAFAFCGAAIPLSPE